MRRKRYKKVFTIKIIFFILSVFVIYINKKFLEEITEEQNMNIPTFKTILIWRTSIQNTMPIGLGSGSEIFKNCPVNNCYITYKKSFINIEDFDAIIFHSPSFKVQQDGIPQKRKMNQKYIFYR